MIIGMYPMDDLVKYYEKCFDIYGDTHKGVDWPNAKDAEIRYKIMLEGVGVNIRSNTNVISILDYGCGLGHFLEYLQEQSTYSQLRYEGCDASEKMIRHCQSKFGKNIFFKCSSDGKIKKQTLYDYIVCNGVFTEKRDYSFEEMLRYSTEIIFSLFSKCQNGLIINFMSTNVDWQRNDLFHLPLDTISAFISKNMSKHFVIRNDYGLHEYTIYIYKNPFPNIFFNNNA